MVVLALILFFFVKMMFGGIFGVSLVVIENGPRSSMYPTYDKGDMFLIYKSSPEKIALGDVIVYESNYASNYGVLIIHRVVNITILESNGVEQYYFRVSGDNEQTNQPIDDFNSTTSLIPYDSVVGKTVFLIPKVGYLRLWLADYPVLRYTLLGLLVILALYLIFVPDKEKDEEEKNEEDTVNDTETIANDETKTEKEQVDKQNSKPLKDKLNEGFKNWWASTKKNFIELFTVKKKRNKLIIYTSAIVLIIIAVPILDAIITSPGLETGIETVIPKGLRYEFSGEGIVYLPITVHFRHDGSYDKILKSFDIYGIQDGTIISHMHWYSFYQKEGDLLIGSTLVFNLDEFNSSLLLTIRINYIVKYRFGSDVPGTYENEFNASITY